MLWQGGLVLCCFVLIWCTQISLGYEHQSNHDDLNERIERVMTKLLESNQDEGNIREKNFTVSVVKRKIPSASVSADRRITISTMMMEMCNSDDELAFVLGHEMGHIILNHPFSNLSVTRRQLEADKLGAKLAIKGHFNAEGGILIIKKMEQWATKQLVADFFTLFWREQSRRIKKRVEQLKILIQEGITNQSWVQ